MYAEGIMAVDETIHVLLVDDDHDRSDQTARCLSIHDRLDVTVTGPDSAVEALFEREIDCLVVDGDLTSQSCMDLLRSVRDIGFSLPSVLYLGGDASELVRAAVESDAATDYVSKAGDTADFDLLAHRIVSVVGTARHAEKYTQTRMWYQTIVEQSLVGLYALQDGTVAFVNDYLADLFGSDPDALVGQSVCDGSPSLLDFVHVDDRHRVEMQIASIAADIRTETPAESYDFDFRLVQDGTDEIRWLTVRAIPVVDDGEVTNILGVVSDLTDRITHEIELAQQNARLESFAHVLSHDIRGPLAVAQGRLDLARESGEPTHLDHVERAHARITEVVEEVLSIARDGVTGDDGTEVPLADAAAAAWEMCNADVDDARCELSELPVVVGDDGQLKRLFENLFRNAIQHGTSDDGTLVIRVGSLPSVGGFYVEDEGPGIQDEIRDDIFLPGITTKDVQTGSGLGLGIVKHIVDMNGWSIRATTARSGGARFEVLFDPLGHEYTSV